MMSNSRRPAPRQSDIARAAGVSQATVSLVINGRADAGRIPEGTRARVLAAAREVGYVPNASARSLRAKRNQLLGVHTSEAVFPGVQHDFYVGFLLGIEERAGEIGNDLVLFTSRGDQGANRKIFRNGENRLTLADGTILLGAARDRSELAHLAHDGYPFVHIGRRDVNGVDIPYIAPDYVSATEAVVRQLAASGHRRIAYVGGTLRDEPHEDRLRGYRTAVGDLALPVLEPHYVSGDAVTEEWLDWVIAHHVTAVISERPVLVGSAMESLLRRGIGVPRDLSIVALQGVSGINVPQRPWSAVIIPQREIGRRAVDLLLSLLDDPSADVDRHILVPCLPANEMTIGPVPRRHP